LGSWKGSDFRQIELQRPLKQRNKSAMWVNSVRRYCTASITNLKTETEFNKKSQKWLIVKVTLNLSLCLTTSALDGGEWSASRPNRFTPGLRAAGTHWTGGWVDPKAVWKRYAQKCIH
jgi:hypothetical protein